MSSEQSSPADDASGPATAAEPVVSERPPFEQVYREQFAFVWRALRCLGVPAAVIDDAAQDVWVVVHRRLPEFEGRSQLKTWLFGIALNVNRNRRRAERRRPAHHALPPEVATNVADPALAREGREAWELVSEYLGTLDESRREVFVCCLLEGLSAPEAAALTGLPLTKVYDRVRALRRSFKSWHSAKSRAGVESHDE